MHGSVFFRQIIWLVHLMRLLVLFKRRVGAKPLPASLEARQAPRASRGGGRGAARVGPVGKQKEEGGGHQADEGKNATMVALLGGILGTHFKELQMETVSPVALVVLQHFVSPPFP